MRPRRSKVVPEPLFYVEGTTTVVATKTDSLPPDASASAAEPSASSVAQTVSTAPVGHLQNGAQRPVVFNKAASPILPPGATAMGSAVKAFSPNLNVYHTNTNGVTLTIAPRTTVLVANHVANTGSVVRLEQVDYSKAMRAYRVCRQEGGIVAEESPQGRHTSSAISMAQLPRPTSPQGTSSSYTTRPSSLSGMTSLKDPASFPAYDYEAPLGHKPAPWRVVFLRLFGAADMVLLAVVVACFLVVVSQLRVVNPYRTDVQGIASSSSSLSWLVVALAAFSSGPAGVNGIEALSDSPLASAERMRQAITGGSQTMSPLTAAVGIPASDTDGGVSGSYAQAKGTPALDTSVTFFLLLLSVFLLVKRLSGALSRVYVEEVLVMRGVGMQFSAYGIFNTLRYRHFVDLLMLRSLIIHDAFFRYQPIFFLSSSVENKAERIVYFPDTLPRLAVLRPVLNGIRGVLYGEPEEGPSLAELEDQWKSTVDFPDGDFFMEDSFAEDTATTPDDACFSEATDHDED
ncbi:GPI-GlcNAc transferase complex, PIG-H component, putative [Leishmania lindenbergi]|uniref:GPI-GlcNAc transferase complex, PIG-H component n=1 Tax=Leishmania lindenbergi TaxID=651832 RepID=A0AAW3AZY2_9TRYP